MKTFLISILSLLLVPSVHAAPLGSTDSIISKPVGSDILPGGNAAAENIRDSILFSNIIPFAINYAIGLAAALAVVVLIIGGYQYLTAYGDTDKDQKARQLIIYALIGLALSLSAYGIVKIVSSIQLV